MFAALLRPPPRLGAGEAGTAAAGEAAAAIAALEAAATAAADGSSALLAAPKSLNV